MGNFKTSSKDYQSTCPLITKRKLLKQKKFLNTIYALDILNYKKKDFIIVGFSGGNIEIYDSLSLEMIAKDDNRNSIEYITYIGNLLNNYFAVVFSYHANIYIFYEENSETSNNSPIYNIKLVQKIIDTKKNKSTFLSYMKRRFSKAFIFNRNLYREYDIYEKNEDKLKVRNNKEYKDSFSIEELIINSNEGIIIYEKKEEKEKNNKFDIYDLLNSWEINAYEYKRIISGNHNYDLIQVNFKYIAGTINDYLCLYSMETYELITKFKVKISTFCDRIIFMLTEDILCIGGDDSISLISIKDFEIVLVSLIRVKYRITEICILPDFNILIGMKNNDGSYKSIEYFYQYKYFKKLNKSKNIEEHCLKKGISKLLTKKESNIRMRCLNDDRLVTVVDLNNIQVWK